MIRTFQDQTFRGFHDRNSGALFSGIEFRKCSFIGCGISTTLNPRLRTTVKDLKMIGCEQRGCIVHAAIFEDITIEDLVTNGLMQSWAAVYKHVVFEGKIDRIMISDCVSPGVATPLDQMAFDQENNAFYASVDWALDLSKANFVECDIRGVPSHLIRRDPDTQIVIKRERLLDGAWRQLDLSGTYWGTAIQLFLKRGHPDRVLVAPKRHKKYRQLLQGLQILRESGIAEPE
jgi:hypothetical protein